MGALRVGLLALLAIAAVPAAAGRAQGPPGGRLDFGRVIQATVQIYACETLPASEDPVAWDDLEAAFDRVTADETCSGGSGTFISPDGTLLTNGHVALHGETAAPLWLLVFRTIDARSLPEPAFFARPLAGSPLGQLDLAVAAPAYTLDGRPIEPGELSVPSLPMGPPGGVDLGDDLLVIGYPAIGGDLITLTRGAVAGFDPDPAVPELGTAGWIKTDAILGSGNSGGTTINDRGELIGVPTEMGEVETGLLPDGILASYSHINHIRPIPEGYEVLRRRAAAAGIEVAELPAAEATTEAAAVVVAGSLRSADSDDPIAGGLVVVLAPGVGVADYKAGRRGAVYDVALSGQDGSFLLERPVARGEAYGLLALADGYHEVALDGQVLATADAPAVVALPPLRLPAIR